MIRAKRQVMLVAIMMCAAGIMVFAIDRADRRLEGPLKAADFVQFYTLGHLASEHRISAMYNMTALHEAQVALVPESKTFLYPPVYPRRSPCCPGRRASPIRRQFLEDRVLAVRRAARADRGSDWHPGVCVADGLVGGADHAGRADAAGVAANSNGRLTTTRTSPPQRRYAR